MSQIMPRASTPEALESTPYSFSFRNEIPPPYAASCIRWYAVLWYLALYERYPWTQ
jgi:hypothetical protein